MEVLLGENLDTEVNSESNIFHKLKTQRFMFHHGCHFLAHSSGNGSELLTHCRVTGTDPAPLAFCHGQTCS